MVASRPCASSVTVCGFGGCSAPSADCCPPSSAARLARAACAASFAAWSSLVSAAAADAAAADVPLPSPTSQRDRLRGGSPSDEAGADIAASALRALCAVPPLPPQPVL
eukprot:scaffold209730_cov27-Tisochrysis_lutea.AAC.1